ncbi:MAG: hypothetical protein ACFFCY_17910 [Promethearchaeota archaeon]
MSLKIYFWSELLRPKLLIPFLEKIGNYNFGLNLAITPNRLKELNHFIKICVKNDVELNFWPLISIKQGYWINKWNIKVFEKWIAYLLENFPNTSAYLLDLENPINFTGVTGIILKRKLNTLISNEDIRFKLEALVDKIHDFGKKVISTTYGGIPLGLSPRPSNADFYSYMVYSSFIKRISSEETRQNIIYYCANKIRIEHGLQKAAIDLGITTYGIYQRSLSNILGYLDLNEILNQIAICKYLKLSRIHIFSFDNMTIEVDKWLENISNVRPKPPPSSHSMKLGLMYYIYEKLLFKMDLTKF